MSYGVPTSSGMLFGPTASGKMYLCSLLHRGINPHNKTKWHPGIKPPDEYELFCRADNNKWHDSTGHYWAVGDKYGRRSLGMNGEVLCKFPCPVNGSDPWHGYPVSPRHHSNDSPPTVFIRRWIRSGIITRTFGKRILKEFL